MTVTPPGPVGPVPDERSPEAAIATRRESNGRGGVLGRYRRTVAPLLTTGSGRRLGDAAAECAFFVALAVLPMMLTTTAALRTLRPAMRRDVTPQVEEGLARMLRVVLTTRGGVASDAAGHLLTADNGGLLTFGTIASLAVVTRAMRSVLTGLHAVRGPADARGTYSTRKLWSLAAALAAVGVVLGALTLAMIAIGPLLGHTRDIAPGADGVVAGVWFVLRWPVGLAAVFGYVLLVHRVGLRHARTTRAVRRRAALVGAATTTAGAVLASLVLPLYVQVAASVSPTTGALGGGLILLLWAYLLMLSLLLGAQVRVRLEGAATSAGIRS